jgi:hypothetical protein
MSQDVLDQLERYLPEDPAQWGRLASEIQFRRLQLLLQREILLELRALRRELGADAEAEEQDHAE